MPSSYMPKPTLQPNPNRPKVDQVQAAKFIPSTTSVTQGIDKLPMDAVDNLYIDVNV